MRTGPQVLLIHKFPEWGDERLFIFATTDVLIWWEIKAEEVGGGDCPGVLIGLGEFFRLSIRLVVNDQDFLWRKVMRVRRGQ